MSDLTAIDLFHLTLDPSPPSHYVRAHPAKDSSNSGQIELNIAGHVPGACREFDQALFYCSEPYRDRSGQPSK